MKLMDIVKQIIAEQRQNNIEPNLKEKLKDAGFNFVAYDWSQVNSEVPLEQATEIRVADPDNIFSTLAIIKLPTQKMVTFEYIMNAIAKKQRVDSSYINLAKYMDAALKSARNIDVYPASYGVGVVSIFNKAKKDDIAAVEKILNDLGVSYTNEYSDAGWTYRFKVSKNAKNIEILSKLG